ncbi:MAG: type II restriction endonuclease [Bacteroidia bacterium]|nr:type II restriction endonuclease [Bacteroidia bacterium]
MRLELQQRLSERRELKDFEEKLRFLDDEGKKIFQGYQEQALYRLVEAWLDSYESLWREEYLDVLQKRGWTHFKKSILPKLVELSQLVQRLEKDLGNMRKARGGALFQVNIQHLLMSEGIPCEIPTGNKASALGRIDLVVPNMEIAQSHPDKAYFITCKRTLRERWKQEVPQGTANRRFYLITLDDSISPSKAEEIRKMNLIAYVPSSVKMKHTDKSWIRSIKDFPKDLRA